MTACFLSKTLCAALALWGVVSAACGASAQSVSAEIPLSGGKAAPALLATQDVDVILRAGIDALHTGLPGFAEKFLSEALERGGLSRADTERAALGLAAAQLSLHRTAEARATLARYVPPDHPGAALRVALVDYREGNVAAAKATLRQCPVDKLPAAERSWWWLLSGLIAETQDDAATAQSCFERARSLAPDGAERALFETAISRGRILTGKATPSMADALRKKVEENKNTRMEPQFAKELAVVLSQLGRRDEALALLRAQIDGLGAQASDEKNQLRLMYAMLDNDSPEARAMLREILRGRGVRDIQQSALFLLSQSPHWRENPAGLLEWLNEALAETPDHPLCDEILQRVARLSFETGDLDAAEKAAARLVAEFPAADGKKRALRLLAQIALGREPPQYRVAADYLNRLRAELPEGDARSRCSLLLADAYFLNGDYANANALYAELMRLPSPPMSRGDLLFREALSAVRAEKFEDAARQLDAAAKLTDVDAENVWRAEWSYLRALQERGRVAEAFARLRARLADGASVSISTDLRLRLQWLEAQLALAAGNAADAAKLAGRLVFMIDTLPADALSADLRRALAAAALLLDGQALLSAGRAEEGFAAFARLRAEQPDSNAAALSGFVAARALAAEGRLADAQRSVMEVAEKYPKNKYAAAALYEAAVLAEGQAAAGAYEQAAALLDELVRKYPASDYVFFARLRQGDLARKLNDFGAALAVYDAVLADYPDHPDRPRAEMARADALLALSVKDAGKYGAAEAAYERLFALPDLPPDMRIEAGFKWGFVLERAGNLADAREAYWLVISRYLRGENATPPEGAGRYWMSRCILQLGDLLASAGEAQNARTVYAFIREYGLPGATVAAARLDAPPAPETPESPAPAPKAP